MRTNHGFFLSALGLSVLLVPGASLYAQQSQLEEIVVTAERRETTVQDVSVAITAIDQQQMFDRNIQNFEDYLRSVPGVNYGDFGSQANEVKIRGVGLGTQRMSQTTAIYMGEVPVIHNGRGLNSSFNFRLIDMSRVEVLRGPQGQLYGANSIGGAIKNVPNLPNLEEWQFIGSGSAGTMEEGEENYDVDLTVNIPFSDTFGARVVGYYLYEAGWYDNVYEGHSGLANFVQPIPPGFPAACGTPVAGAPGFTSFACNNPDVAAYSEPSKKRDDTNTNEVYGGRLMLRWQATDSFSADFMLSYQEMDRDGTSSASDVPNVPGPIPGTISRGPGQNPQLYPTDLKSYEYSSVFDAANTDELLLANLLFTWDIGLGELISSTSYWDRKETLETTIPLDAITTSTGIPPGSIFPGVNNTFGVVVDRADEPTMVSQEFRLASPSEQRLTWLAGVFWQEIDQDWRVEVLDLSGETDILRRGFPFYFPPDSLFPGFPGGPPGPPRIPGQEQVRIGDFEEEQIALFGELKYDIVENVNLAFSFRYLEQDQSAFQENFGYFNANIEDTDRDNDEDEFLPKFVATWTPNDDMLYYASASKGWRSGVTNLAVSPGDPFGSGDCDTELAAVGQPGGIEPTDPDTLWNYELGAKTTLFNGRTQLNAAIYHIDWKDLQQQVFLSNFFPGPGTSQCNIDVIFNVGDATIQGAEVELTTLLTEGLRLNVSGSYTDAEHDTTIPELSIFDGQTIQLTPEWQAFVGLQYDFELMRRNAFARADLTYTGDMVPRAGDFLDAPPIELGEYSVVNLAAGMSFTEQLSLDIWVKNVFDEFGVTRAFDLGNSALGTYHTIRPRLVGATLRFRFE